MLKNNQIYLIYLSICFFIFLFDAFIFIEILSLLSKIKYQWEKKNISIFWKKHTFFVWLFFVLFISSLTVILINIHPCVTFLQFAPTNVVRHIENIIQSLNFIFPLQKIYEEKSNEILQYSLANMFLWSFLITINHI